MANHIKNLAGQRDGKLVAVSVSRSDNKGRKVWLLRCDCGNEVERLSSIMSDAINKGKDSHCGCSPARKTHGLTSKKKNLYWVWAAMIQRCENPENKDYSTYGGRGIAVCEEWRNSFKSFHDWAKASGYKKGLTIERVDVDKGYSNDNCIWIINARQSLNCRRSAIITWNGKSQHISDWADDLGIKYKTLRGRIFDYGWSLDRALAEKTRSRSNAK